MKPSNSYIQFGCSLYLGNIRWINWIFKTFTKYWPRCPWDNDVIACQNCPLLRNSYMSLHFQAFCIHTIQIFSSMTDSWWSEIALIWYELLFSNFTKQKVTKRHKSYYLRHHAGFPFICFSNRRKEGRLQIGKRGINILCTVTHFRKPKI